jgi:hypothetical protein
MRSLVAQRLPIVNVPQVRVGEAVSGHHAWQTFTVSPSLPRGLWLLRRRRPPARTLALSCPPEGGKARGEFPSSNARDASHPSRPPRRRAAWEQRLPTCGLHRPSAMPLWLWGVSTTLHPARFTTLHTEVPRVRRGRRTRAVRRPWLGHRRPFLRRLQTPGIANP